MHLVDNADFVHTFADIVQTQSRQYAEYHTPVRLAHFSVVISCEFNYRALGSVGQGPADVAPRGRVSACCFPALRRVEEPKDQG